MPRRSNTRALPADERGIFLAPFTRNGCMVVYARSSRGEVWECLADGVKVTESDAVAWLASLLRDYDAAPAAPIVHLSLASGGAFAEPTPPRARLSLLRCTASRPRSRGSVH